MSTNVPNKNEWKHCWENDVNKFSQINQLDSWIVKPVHEKATVFATLESANDCEYADVQVQY